MMSTRELSGEPGQAPYLQWSEGEPGAYGPNREYLDIAAIPDDEHIVDVAITALPAGFKAVRFGDDAKEENLPTWWFHLGSATEQRDFYQGWYKATLQIAAEGNDPPLSKELVVALGLTKDGLYAELHLEDWDAIGGSLPTVPQNLPRIYQAYDPNQQ